MNDSATETAPRIAVVGLGLIAQVAHLPALTALGDRVVVSHLCDISPGVASAIRASGWPDAKTTTDWTELLTADVDAVVVCTPGSHGRIAGALVAAGKHVLAEKPLCLSQAEAARLAASAEAAGVVLQVGYMKSADPIVRATADRLDDIGELRHVRVTVLHPSDESQTGHLRLHRGAPADPGEVSAAIEYENEELRRALGDVPGSIRQLYNDVLAGSVVHQTALLRAITGASPITWDSVLAHGLVDAEHLAEPPCIQATARLGDRSSTTLSWNWVPDHPTYEEDVVVIGSAGSIHLSLSPPYVHRPPVLTAHVLAQGERRSTSTTGGDVDAFQHQMLAFVDAITTGGPVLATAEHARQDLASLQRLVAGAAAGIGVTVAGEAAQ